MRLRLTEAERAFFRRKGKKGGEKRAANLTTEQLAAIGRKGAAARLAKREAKSA